MMDPSVLKQIPKLPQRQDSALEQMDDLRRVAVQLGMYDAADAITQLTPGLKDLKYGCHCDLEAGMEPDGCVIDTNSHHECIYAKPDMRKENCVYWQIFDRKEG